MVENATGPVYQAAASDPDGGTLTYALSGGADATRFSMNATGQLSFIASPNFDLPTDADRNNVYQVEISVSDGQASTMLALAVTVTNSKEGVAVHRIATGFTDPVAIATVSTAEVLVAEKAGAIYSLNTQAGTRKLLVQIANVGGVGVTALAAGTRYVLDGAFFVMYTSDTGALIINRYLRNPTGTTVADNFGPLLSVAAPDYAGGGWLGYGPGGNLLAATGDAGGNGDPTGSAQSDASRLGKLLRIEANSDPYAGTAPSFFLISAFGKGLHRPNGGSVFGRAVLIADRGQEAAEELNFFAGSSTVRNFGWPSKEGSRVTRGTPPTDLTDPVLEYFRSAGLRTGQAVVGGGSGPSVVASLRNQYVFGDESGAIFAVPNTSLADGKTTSSDVMERRDADFVPDQGNIDRPVVITPGAGGETLYIMDGDGELFRVDGA